MSQTPYRLDGGRYEVQSLIGRGGMAEVHKAYDTLLSRTVAIKMLRFDLAKVDVFLTRFRREAQASASLSHENIVAVYDTGEQQIQLADGSTVFVPYIVMEYVEGHTVRELLTDGQPVPIGEAVQIMSGVLSALEYAHKRNLVHRDIKPANVMITNDCRIKVMDFGIARVLEDSAATMTATDAVVGTAQYLSPEQARGEQVDTRSDLYSAGCMLFELLTGRSPFKGDSAVAVAYQHVAELPPLPSSITPDIPPALDAVCMKALAKSVDERYQSAAVMRSDLQNAFAGRPIIAPLVAGSPSAPAPVDATTMLAPTPAVTDPNSLSATRVMNVAGAAASYPTGQYPAYPTYAASSSQSALSAPPFPGPETGEKRSSNSAKVAIITILSLLALIGAGALAWIYFSSDSTVKNDVTVPVGLVGMSKSEAMSALEHAGLQGEVTGEKPSIDYEAGKVISSDPESGEKVQKGSIVRLTLSSGPDSVEVPDLSGLSQENARLNLRNKGLEMGDVTTEDDPDVIEGRVIRSEPAAGSSVKKGSAVAIVISSGYVKLDESQVVGQPLKDALAYLGKLHLSSNTIKEPTSEAPEGTVLSVTPTGLLKQNSQVLLKVAEKPARPSRPTGGTTGNGSGSTGGTGNGSGTGSGVGSGSGSSSGGNSGNTSGGTGGAGGSADSTDD